MYIAIKEVGYESLIFITNEQIQSLLIHSPSWEVDFRFKGPIFGVEACFVLVLFSRDLHMSFLSLKEKVLLWKFDVRVEGNPCVLVAFSRDLHIFPSRWQRRSWLTRLVFKVGRILCVLILSAMKLWMSFFSLKEKVLILKAFLLERESLILEEESFSFNSKDLCFGINFFRFLNSTQTGGLLIEKSPLWLRVKHWIWTPCGPIILP